MVLSEKDRQLFYELWKPLLDFVNKKYQVNKKLKDIANASMLNPRDVKEIADVLWSHVEVIDEYLEACAPEMPEDHRQIVASWKNCQSGKYIMERHLKKGSIFISEEDEKVYQVQGITSTWEEMFPEVPLPILMKATLIPFRDVIISDGLVIAYPVLIGKNMAKQFKDMYMEAKKDGRVIRTFGGTLMGTATGTSTGSLKEERAAQESEAHSNVIDLQSKRAERQKKKGNKKPNSWKAFKKLQNKCYGNLADVETDDSCWIQSFELFKDLILEKRKQDPSYAPQLDILDDMTDFEYDLQGWLEDCLDEVDMSGEFETVLKMCDDLLELFAWPGYTGSDIKFQKVATLGALGRSNEAQKFCKEWLRLEPGNIVAATAGVYVYMDARDYSAAEALVKQFIGKDTDCTLENDSMFVAALHLYQAMGKNKEKRRIDKAIQKYEKELEQYFMGGLDEFDEEDDYDLNFLDEDLPF